MPRITVRSLFLIVGLIAILTIPVGWLVRHSTLWGPAERVADVLYSLAGEVLEKNLTEMEILNLVKSPGYQEAGIRRLHASVEKREGEFVWFRPNHKYAVGLGNDGRVLWMINGKRPADDCEGRFADVRTDAMLCPRYRRRLS